MRRNLIEVLKWMEGFKNGNINKVLGVSEPGRTRSIGFVLGKFWFNKDI